MSSMPHDAVSPTASPASRENCSDIQPVARAASPYCGAKVDSASLWEWDSINEISFRARVMAMVGVNYT